jgi:hypothetical protein
MSQLMVFLPAGIIAIVIALGFLIHAFGFKRAVRYLFWYGLLATIGAMIILPVIFPSLNGGLGIGFLIAIIAGPIFIILALINLVYWSADRIKKKREPGVSSNPQG